MAPAAKRPSFAKGMEPEVDSISQNSITVAGAIAVAAADGSDTSSRRSQSPAVGEKAGDVARPDTADSVKGDINATMDAAMAPAAPQQANNNYHDYEFSDLDEITVRQLNEDILAYNYDLEYCRAQLEEAADLNPQETRTLQLRVLDLGHQIRHCRHRIETIVAQTRKQHPAFRTPYAHGGAMAPLTANPAINNGKQAWNVSGISGVAVARGKRPVEDEDEGGAKRAKIASSPDMEMLAVASDDSVNTMLQRLGFWKCRLCSAPKYLLAGAGRSPAAPCKWPLKDISKMITHFTEMHGEHTPAERCHELGAALAQNRGPFEYWLRKTRAQAINDESVIDDCVAVLLDGKMPVLLRRHSRAAAGMPTS